MILDATDPETRATAIEQAATVVRRGKIVVLPTDTVYGVGADAFDVVAVAMVLAAKHRGREMPPPVLVGRPETVDGLATDVPMYARILMRQFWPGALTLVLRAQPSLTWDLGETNGTVAVRMPDDEVAIELLREIGPMAVTSANVTGNPAATTAHEAQEQLGGAVTVYLDAGPRDDSTASTIVDCTGEEPVVLRHGALPADALREVLGTTVLYDGPRAESDEAGDGSDGGPDGDPTAGGDPAPDGGPTSGGDQDQGDRPEPPRLVGSIQPSGIPTPGDALTTVPPR